VIHYFSGEPIAILGIRGKPEDVSCYTRSFVLRAIIIVLLAGLAGCGREAGWQPLPAQRAASGARDPGELSNSVRMDDATASEYIVKDITEDPSAWRWALVRPELKLIVKDARKLKLWMELAIPPVTFRVTGPVVVTAYVNGRSLGPMRFAEPGRHRYEKPVPDGWVQPDVPVIVAAEVDKRWISKDDGAQLSFLLNSVGLTP
jgi:hypothetical protein